MKRVFFLIALAMLLAMLASCGSRTFEPIEESPIPSEPAMAELTPSPSPTPLSSPTPAPSEEPAYRNALTGVAASAAPSYRPIAIMVNNIKEAQPLYGIGKADIIYETQAEGGVTRLLAVFEDISKINVVGSIRSARDYYIDLAQGLNAVFTHCGTSPLAATAIANRGLKTIDGLSGSYANTFYRDKGRKAAGYAYEHQLFTDAERLVAAEEKLGAVYNDKFDNTLKFSDTPLQGVKTTPATSINVKHSGYKSTLFEYDSASGTYAVSQFKKAMNDADTGEQLAVSNVLVLKTAISNIKGDTSGRVSVRLTGSGDGMFYCEGKAVAVKWSKKDAGSPFNYTLSDGMPLMLARGVTYINIVASDAVVSVDE